MSLKGSRILLVGGDDALRESVGVMLRDEGYALSQVVSGDEALDFISRDVPDLVIIDLHFCGIDGFDVCRLIRDRFPAAFLPIIVLSGDALFSEDRVRELEGGAYDYLYKPVVGKELRMKVASFLKMRNLYAAVESQRVRLTALSERQENIIRDEQTKVSSLRRFFSPQVADVILAAPNLDVVSPHKQDVTVCFVDLRGFTAFAEVTNPDLVIKIILEYYKIVCSIALSYGGTISSLAGDGIMVFFNDPVPVNLHTEAAVNFLFEVRGELNERAQSWQEMGYALGFGAGMARGESIVGAIGFDRFIQYTAISTTVNLAARLSKEAKVGQVLATLRGLREVEGRIEMEPAGMMALKGIHMPVNAMNILRWK